MRNVSFMTSLRLAHRTAMKNLAEGQAYQPLRQWIKTPRTVNGVEMTVDAMIAAVHNAHVVAKPISLKRGEWRLAAKGKGQKK